MAVRGDFHGAEAELPRGSGQPRYPGALGNPSQLLAARGALDEALLYFARTVELKLGDAEIRTNYAVTLASSPRFAEAWTRIDPGRGGGSEIGGRAQCSREVVGAARDNTAALPEFLQKVKLRPDFGHAQLNAARILAPLGTVRAQLKTPYGKWARDSAYLVIISPLVAFTSAR